VRSYINMRFLALLLGLLAGICAVFAAPHPNAELEARGGEVYDVTTIIIVAVTYVVTVEEVLYEVKCDYDKWKKECDYKVQIVIFQC